MGRPRLLVLVRHAQSEGNQNRSLHQIIPDHRVKLTPTGRGQAQDAGHRLKALLHPTDTIQIFTSPYRRTKETTDGILSTLTGPDPTSGAPSPFRRDAIRVYEEPRLREQDFGNFQPCSAEMERMWQERADYGHFFYRIPNGESAADAYDRVAGFNETLFRNFSDEDFPSVCVLVTHGLLARVWLMKWFHWSTAYFEDLKNVEHCELLVMRRNDEDETVPVEKRKYVLENKLRTWSEDNADKAKTAESSHGHTAPAGLKNGSMSLAIRTGAAGVPMSPSIPPRMWGGCVGGCDHTPGPTKRVMMKTPNTPLTLGPTGMDLSAGDDEKLEEDEAAARSDGERAYSDDDDDDNVDNHSDKPVPVPKTSKSPLSANPVLQPIDTSAKKRRPSRRQPTDQDVADWVAQSGMGSGARADALVDEPCETCEAASDPPSGARTGSVAEEVL